MEKEVTAAIIAAGGVVVAASIPIICKIFPRKPKQKDKLSIAFQFGYYSMELYYSIKFKYEAEKIITTQDFIRIQDILINESKTKCQNLAKQLEIDFSPNSIENNKEVYDYLPYISEIETAIVSLPMPVRCSVNSARRLSAVFHRDYQFNFLNLTGSRFTEEQINFVTNELDDETKKAIQDFRKTNVNKKALNNLLDYINYLRTASKISKEDWANSLSKIRSLIEEVALRITQ